MAYAVITPSISGNRVIYDALTAGATVELRAEPDNPKDPNAVVVYFNEEAIGYLANRLNDTVPKGAWPASKVAKNLGLPTVAGAYAKLTDSFTYVVKERDAKTGSVRLDAAGKAIPKLDVLGNPITQVHWYAELFWLPVWDTAGDQNDLLTLKVGGSAVLNGDKAFVLSHFSTITPDDIIVRLETINGVTKASLFRKELLNNPNPSPCGEVQEPPDELMVALEAGAALPVTPVKQLVKGAYSVTVQLQKTSLDVFQPEMDAIVKGCIMQVRDIKERTQYMVNQHVPEHIIRGVLTSILAPCCNRPIQKPIQLYMQTISDNILTRALAYHLAGKNMRLVGEKGAGKNTLVMTVCWLFNQPMCRIQGNADLDKIDLLGGQTLNDHGTAFVLSSFMETLRDGGDVVLDEVNAIKPEIALILHSIADDAKSIEVPGYGPVEVNPRSRLWLTMNEMYVGTGEMNPATVDRFVPLFLGNQTDIARLLKTRFPEVKEEVITTCSTLYGRVLKAVREGRCSSDTITTRGYIDAVEGAKWLPLKVSLIDNVAHRSQDEADRKAIEELIRAMFL